MDGKMSRRVFVILFAISTALLVFTGRAFSQAAGCNYYASPTGSGNGLSQSSPFKIASFWSVAGPGKTLCLLDGTYTDGASMINPPQNLRGRSGAPITVKALNDGKVLINGQAARAPIKLYLNDWFVIDGVNACCSGQFEDVVFLGGNHNVIRRVAAWDAHDGNTNIFGVHGAEYILLEDVAGWGIARKTFSSSEGGNFTTIRRAWARWEGSHVVGPKIVYELAYNNYDMIIENAIGAWSGEKMKQSYVLLDYYGLPWTGVGAGTYTNYAVDQPYGIFSIGGFSNGNPPIARSKLLGSLAYVKASDRFHAEKVVFILKVDSFEVNNTLAYVQHGNYSNVWPFGLFNLTTGVGTNLAARNLTSIGGSGSYFDSEWRKSNILEGPNPGIYNSGENIFNTTRGANLCYRYQDGVLTNQPLWPWPMNQRIIDAMIMSGRAPVDLTATIEAMFGPIPTGCRTTTSGVPSAPTDLKANP